MPELPEVETVRRTLIDRLLGETIDAVKVSYGKMIKQPDDVQQFEQLLAGQKIIGIERRGKFLIFKLTDIDLVSHLRMEGKFQIHDKQAEKEKHTHVVFYLQSDKALHYNDVRKFGTMHIFDKDRAIFEPPIQSMGQDLYLDDIDIPVVTLKINKSTRAIKNILLDQTILTGLGNIYVDETLFLASVHPETRGIDLSEAEIQTIIKHAISVIQAAVEQGGTTIRSYVDAKGDMGMFQQTLKVYGQTGLPCVSCKHPIEKTKVSGRGTHFCPVCQPKL